MLPTFYVWNQMNEAIKKSSDIDKMAGSVGLVGFSVENESNIFATIETENCKPGYLRLRVVGNGEIIRTPEISEYANKILARNFIKSYEQHERRCHKTSFTRGPARTNISYADYPDTDVVYYFSCSSWPLIARTWIYRERRRKWPSNEIIREIVSKGCRIVHKAHPSSRDPDAEFRFSFSVAELILFNTLSVDQKKCFIAFKALVKYRIYRSEIIKKNKIDLSSYHLKTIFLWTCETIPADQWHTTTGWARCLLYMIDQLYACLESRTLPGYFIPECNLLDSIELTKAFLCEIKKLRNNPITSAATFLDSTKCFRHSHFRISDHIQDMCGFDLIETLILRRQLIYLQKMTIEMDSNRGVTFWRKEAVLRILATWCRQNSHGIHIAPWQCLTKEMTLFDVVYLDILHGFDVPNNVLLEYVDKEWSAEVVCKLACCYSMTALKREDRKNKVEYSLHFKTLLMIHRAISYKVPTLECIITAVLILMRCKEYDMVARVLESEIHECASGERYIQCGELYIDSVSHKMKNEIQEMFDIQICRCENESMFFSIPVLIWYSLSMCYRYYIDDEEKHETMIELMEDLIVSACSNLEVRCFAWQYANVLLILQVFENSEKWKSIHYTIYKKIVSIKIKLIEREAEARKDAFEKALSSNEYHDIYFPTLMHSSFCSCSFLIALAFPIFTDRLAHVGGLGFAEMMNNLETAFKYRIATTADKTYYSQFLISNRKLEQAISILKDVVEQEEDYSTSMVIWPKELYGSLFIDENLRNELIKSSKDYVVFPTNLYARYLLTIAYRSLGQEENRRHNLAELIVLRERYSRIQEFAPMLNIMTRVVVI